MRRLAPRKRGFKQEREGEVTQKTLRAAPLDGAPSQNGRQFPPVPVASRQPELSVRGWFARQTPRLQWDRLPRRSGTRGRARRGGHSATRLDPNSGSPEPPTAAAPFTARRSPHRCAAAVPWCQIPPPPHPSRVLSLKPCRQVLPTLQLKTKFSAMAPPRSAGSAAPKAAQAAGGSPRTPLRAGAAFPGAPRKGATSPSGLARQESRAREGRRAFAAATQTGIRGVD